MAIRTLRYEHDELLRKKSRPVKEINDHIITLLDDLFDTMHEKEGIGIAAPQVGVLRRVFVIELEDEVYEFINPEILSTEGSQQREEGCLSLPGKTGLVERPTYVKVKALNRAGEEIIVEAEDVLAIAVCHELDHLDGILYTDRVIPAEGEDEKE